MARTPVIKHNGVVYAGSVTCKRCPHLLSAHDEDKCRMCSQCACIAQDTADARPTQ